MRKQIEYLKYVLQHKWYVLICCKRMGIPWRGLTHDLSKFSLAEWPGYVNWFKGPYGVKVTGSIRSECLSKYEELKHKQAHMGFKRGWLHHQHVNPHHWNYWVLDEEPLPMPEVHIREMIADWMAMSMVFKNDVTEWYEKMKKTMNLHPDTKAKVESFLYPIVEVD